MKKAIALLATMAVVATTAFAQLAPTISGYAETKWGTNLNDETDGFELDSSVTVEVPLFASETAATEDGEGATGSAEITGSSLTFTLGLDDMDDDDNFLTDDLNSADSVLKGTDASISAKIKFGNGLYATIGSESDIATNKVESPRDHLDVNPSYGEEEGISFGYEKDGITFEVTVANQVEGYAKNETQEAGESTDDNGNTVGNDAQWFNGDLDVIKEDTVEKLAESDAIEAPAAQDGYIFGATASYTTDAVALEVAFATNSGAKDDNDDNFEDNKKTSFAAKASYTGVEGLTIAVPFDFLTNDKQQAFELMPSVDYAAGAVEAGLTLHYISLNDEHVFVDTDLKAAAYSGTRLTVDGAYTLDAGKATLELGTALGENALTLDGPLSVAADAAIGVVGDAKDMDLTVKLGFVADTYSVTVDLGDVLYKAAEGTEEADGMDDLGFDATYTGIAGLSASVETTISLDEERGDYTESFTLDALNLDLTSELHGVENTTFTINFSEWDGSKAKKGIFYVGAKISL